MKVFALGGYGKVGFPAVKLLAASDLVTEIAVAGRSLERAQKAAAEIGEMPVTTTAVDVDGTDEQKLTSLLAGYDLIISAATNKAVLPAIRAAMQNGAHYCDAAWGITVDQALQLAPEAAGTGTTAILANGMSPCISNLMGVHVARQLEEVEQLQLGRADIYSFQSGQELTPRQWVEDPKGSLAALPKFRAYIAMALKKLQDNGIRTMRVYHDGQWIEKDPISSGLEVPLPQGGTVTSYPYYAGDPLVPWGYLPRDLARVPAVDVWFSPFPPQLHDLLREQALRILEGHVDADTAVSAFYDAIEGDPHRWLTLSDSLVPTPKLWVRAVGCQEGRAARYTCWFTAPMWDVGGYFLTSVALAVAARKILRGEIPERGVMAAETAFEPQSFFDEVVAVLPEPPPDGRLISESFEWLE